MVPAGARISAGKSGGCEVVAERRGQLGEPVAHELHAVARVAREPDHDLVECLRSRVGVASTVTVDHQLSQLSVRVTCATPLPIETASRVFNRPRASPQYRRAHPGPVFGAFQLVACGRQASRASSTCSIRRRRLGAGAGLGPGDDLRFDLDPRGGRARRPGRNDGGRADDHDLVAGVEGLHPRCRLQHCDGDRDGPAVEAGRHLQLHEHFSEGSTRTSAGLEQVPGMTARLSDVSMGVHENSLVW